MVLESLTVSSLYSLGAVEPAPGVNGEGIEIARECLEEAFKLNTSPAGDRIKPDSLVDIFSSLENNKLPENKSDHGQGSTSVGAPSSSAGQDTAAANLSKASKSLVRAHYLVHSFENSYANQHGYKCIGCIVFQSSIYLMKMSTSLQSDIGNLGKTGPRERWGLVGLLFSLNVRN